jgi:16S rRNA (cytosine1407-C5)-methyltransferase
MKKRKKNRTNTEPVNPLADMVNRFQVLLPADQWNLVLEELNQPYYQAVRLNPLKTNKSIDDLAVEYRWTYKPVPYCDTGFWITENTLPLSKTVEHQMGHYYIQDAASMLPVELFDFEDLEQPLILDMAASPGGKTTHLLSKTADTGLVIANDSSRDRLTALRIVLQNWGAVHNAVTNYPGEKFGAWYPETFDRILLDAPCSMQGLQAAESHPLRGITQKEINALANRQSKLLSSAITTLKTEGQVVYSTCTLTPEENEGVLQRVLDEFGAAIQIDSFSNRFPSSSRGLSHYEENHFDPQIQNAARLWPFVFGTAGFFAARITKKAPLESKQSLPPARPLEQAGWFPLAQQEVLNLCSEIQRTYGLDFLTLKQTQNWEIWTYKQNLYCFPIQFLTFFSQLPVQSLGLTLAENNSEGIILSHEFITRFGDLATQNLVFLDESQSEEWMRGNDLSISISSQGSNPVMIIFDHQHRVIGRGRISQDRLRNLLPHRLRLI